MANGWPTALPPSTSTPTPRRPSCGCSQLQAANPQGHRRPARRRWHSVLPDGKRILFLSSRSGSQQIWLASFDSATGTTRNPYDAAPANGPFQLTHNSVEPDNALWSPDGKFIVFTADVYPDCPAFSESTAASEGSEADTCNSSRDKAAADSKVKAQIFTTYSIAIGTTTPERSAATCFPSL